jgi:hypothetical protein
MATAGNTGQFEYWKPGGEEERHLRVFISHRYTKDEKVYDEVIAGLIREGFAVQDLSVRENEQIKGPMGGELPDMAVMSEIAARIFTSDILVAPSRVGAGLSPWVAWEVQLAAVGYGLPILFVNEPGQQRSASMVSQVQKIKVTSKSCEPTTQQIVRSIIELIGGRPRWSVRLEEHDRALHYRGPPKAARDSVMLAFPFRPSLPSVDLPARAKRGFWPFGNSGA